MQGWLIRQGVNVPTLYFHEAGDMFLVPTMCQQTVKRIIFLDDIKILSIQEEKILVRQTPAQDLILISRWCKIGVILLKSLDLHWCKWESNQAGKECTWIKDTV